MVWLGRRRGNLVDWTTQRWVQWTGRDVATADAPWLRGPIGATTGIGPRFFDELAAARGLEVLAPVDAPGLLPSFAALAGPRFDPSAVDPAIVRFYERTREHDLVIEPRWRGVFRPMGWLVKFLFSNRLEQLDMPLSPRALEAGVESRIVALVDPRTHARRHTGWVRTAIASGKPVFVGDYGIAEIPGHRGPCVRVVFPLPNGNAIIALRPRNEANGGLALVSDGRGFGDPGFYFTIGAGEQHVRARYVRTMKESLVLAAAGESVTAVHRFAVFGATFLELGYRIRWRGDLGHPGGFTTRSSPAPVMSE